MKTWLKENWKIIILIVFVIYAFYWFAWRPERIRSYCMEQSVPANIKDERDWAPDKDIFGLGDALYQNCIRLYGLYR